MDVHRACKGAEPTETVTTSYYVTIDGITTENMGMIMDRKSRTVEPINDQAMIRNNNDT
jgi:hypothetical protein